MIRRIAPLTVAALISLSFSGCTRTEDDGNLQVFHGQISDDVKSWDPATAFDVISLDLIPSIYETLYQYGYLEDPYRIVPLLAADVPKMSADRLTVTIPLRHGVKFQDDPCFKDTKGKGRELTAHDFVYAFKRLGLPGLASPGWWILDGKLVGLNELQKRMAAVQGANAKTELAKLLEEPVEGVKAIDDYTLQLKLTRPYPQLPYVLAMSATAPIARESVREYADERGAMNEHPVGTGPFRLKSWNRGRRIQLDQNPGFHPDHYPVNGAIDYRRRGMLEDAGKVLPFLDRISVSVVPEQQPGWLGFLKGATDVVKLPRDNFQQAIAQQNSLKPEFTGRGMRLNVSVGATFYYVSFNMKDPVLGKNKLLRQALSSAVDRVRWLDIITAGSGRKATTALPPGLADRPESSVIKYDYDLARAKQLLAKAGYPEGKGLPVLNFDLRGADTISRQAGDYFAQAFGAIGVKINLISNTFPNFLEKMRLGSFQISYGGWTLDYPDAENVYQLLYGPNHAPGPNDSNFDDARMNKLFAEMAALEPSPRRAKLIAQMDEILQEECPWALGFYKTQYEVSQPWLLNFRASELILNRYKYLRINREAKQRYLENSRR